MWYGFFGHAEEATIWIRGYDDHWGAWRGVPNETGMIVNYLPITEALLEGTPQEAAHRRDARQAFMQHHAEITRLLAALTANAEDHFGKSPDEINWADAGSAEEMVVRLRELMMFGGV